MKEDQLEGVKQQKLFDIDCIIIGVNCEKTLARCIQSILDGSYPADRLHIYYSDGGSTDSSVNVARSFKQVSVFELKETYPTPGKGRNFGWRNSSSPYVQFLDSDTLLDAHWLSKAVEALSDDPAIGAVFGLRREIHPDKTLFNWIGDIEWNGPEGQSECFGGDVCIRRSALEKTDGYDEVLVGGEDPELSRRIIRAGWYLIRIDAPMTMHDLAMTTIKQYLRRAFRSGYAYGAVRNREAKAKSPFWQYEVRKIVIKSSSFICFTALFLLLALFRQPAIVTISALFLFLIGSSLLLSPRLFRVNKFIHELKMSRKEAKLYAWHCSVVVIPQFFGLFRFYAGKLFNKPLKNKRKNLKTALSTNG
jgi:cellulose synthase/poly-beta-1,6-N-acetylglucosamine synthase-like glycosyltransferase